MSSYKIHPSAVIRFLILEWIEPDWMSGHPVIILEPVVRYFQDTDLNSALEDLMIDMAIDYERGEITEDEDIEDEFEWRGWNLPYLKRVARQCLKGKTFPKRGYRAHQVFAAPFASEDIPGTHELRIIPGPSAPLAAQQAMAPYAFELAEKQGVKGEPG